MNESRFLDEPNFDRRKSQSSRSSAADLTAPSLYLHAYFFRYQAEGFNNLYGKKVVRERTPSCFRYLLDFSVIVGDTVTTLNLEREKNV